MIATKWEFPCYSFYDVKGIEKHLEKMAAKGWMLEKLGGYGWRYVRCEPKKLHFTVTYYPKASAFDPEPTDGQQTFEEFCEYSGWHLVASSAKLMVFANEKETPVPIHTDPGTELEIMERMGKQNAVAWVVLLAFMLWNLYLNVKQFLFNPISYFVSNFTIGFGLVEILLSIYIVLDLCTWYIWRKKARTAAEQGEELPEIRGHKGLIRFTFSIAGLVILITLLFGGQAGLRSMLLLYLMGMTALILAVNGVRLALKKRKASREKNMVITLALDVVMVVLLTVGVIWGPMQFREIGDHQSQKPAVTAELLTGIPQPGAIRDVSRYSSLFLKETKVWDMPSGEVPLENVRSLDYDLLEVRFQPVYDICLNELYHRYDHYGDHSENYDEDTPFYVYEPADPACWGAKQVRQLRAYGELKPTYLVCWDKVILEFRADWPISEHEILLAAEHLKPVP